MTMDKESAKTTWYSLNSELRQALTEIVLEEQQISPTTSQNQNLPVMDPELRSLLTEQNKILARLEQNLRLMLPDKYSM